LMLSVIPMLMIYLMNLAGYHRSTILLSSTQVLGIATVLCNVYVVGKAMSFL
jgi:hypothetical protein